jgi:hypothetical protein
MKFYLKNIHEVFMATSKCQSYNFKNKKNPLALFSNLDRFDGVLKYFSFVERPSLDVILGNS